MFVEKINLINQTIESVLQVVNNYVLDCKNEKLKKLCTKIIGDYEIILDECKIIAKNYKNKLTDLSFFEKYSNLISIKIASINKKNTFEISKNIYFSVCEIMPNLYHSLSPAQPTDQGKVPYKLKQSASVLSGAS